MSQPRADQHHGGVAVRETARLTAERRELSSQEAEELNRRLTILHHLTYNSRMAKANQIVATVKYYVPCTDEHSFSCGIRGQYMTETGIVWKVDMEASQTITINHKNIAFDDILSVKADNESIFSRSWEE